MFDQIDEPYIPDSIAVDREYYFKLKEDLQYFDTTINQVYEIIETIGDAEWKIEQISNLLHQLEQTLNKGW